VSWRFSLITSLCWLLGIIYCFSKKETEKVCIDLKGVIPELSGKITFYHSDVPVEEKERRQRLWSKGDIKVTGLILSSRI
jgi:superfamily II DNA helicase RecQ